MLERVLLLILKGFFWIIQKMPPRMAVWGLAWFFRAIALCVPRYRCVAMRNLDIAFPDRDLQWKCEVYRRSFTELARLMVDFARLPLLDEAWVAAHITCTLPDGYAAYKAQDPSRGILIITGHLGSFELASHYFPMVGCPISFVVRNFKLERIDRWWTALRQARGNRSIARQGAFSEVWKTLRRGEDVAVLFDQNVTRNHATFVDFFGMSAATTKMPAIAALRGKARSLVGTLRYQGLGTYSLELVDVALDDIYEQDKLSFDEKVKCITERWSKVFEQRVREFPEGWFWMHRRWRTRPEESEENPYAIK